MALGYKVRVQGERQLVMALKKADSELKPMFEEKLRKAAEVVSEEAERRTDKYTGRGPIRGRLRGFTAIAESRARSRGLRPDFGSLIMVKGLLPARTVKMDETIKSVEQGLDLLGMRNGF